MLLVYSSMCENVFEFHNLCSVEVSVLLEARYVGYFPFEIRISSKNLHLPIKIELVRSIDLNEVAVGGLICVIEKPKWYQF